MKQQIYFFLLFICAHACLYAQGNVFYTATIQEDLLFEAENVQPPLWNWTNQTNNYSVSFIEEHEKDIFCLVNHSKFFLTYSFSPAPAPWCNIYYAEVDIPDDLCLFHVYDIYIVDDYAFFCGSITDTLTYSSHALFGYFDLNGFFNDSLMIYIDTILDGTTAAPKELERLVAYKHNSVYKVVTYGYDVNSGKYKVLEINNALQPDNSCNVAEMGHFFLNNIFMVSDILLTMSYVVIVGYDANHFVGYACGSRASVVSDICSPNANKVLYSVNETNGFVKGTVLEKDTFALAYVHFDDILQEYYTSIRLIEPGRSSTIYSYQFEKPDKEDPVKMIYLTDRKTIELLQPVYDSTDFISLQPTIGMDYSTSYLSPETVAYNNLYNIGGHCFISFHKDHYYIENRQATLPHSKPSCPADGTLVVKDIPNVLIGDVGDNSLKTNEVLPINPYLVAPVFKEQLKPHCYSFEIRLK